MNQKFLDACKTGNLSEAQQLITQGVDVNCTIEGGGGYTGLIYASFEGYADMVRLLLNNGADANIKDDDQWTCFLHACHEGNIGVVRELIRRDDVDINQVDQWGQTGLMIASARGLTIVVQELLLNGANFRLQEKRSKKSAFDKAKENGHHFVANLIEAYSRVSK